MFWNQSTCWYLSNFNQNHVDFKVIPIVNFVISFWKFLSRVTIAIWNTLKNRQLWFLSSFWLLLFYHDASKIQLKLRSSVPCHRLLRLSWILESKNGPYQTKMAVWRYNEISSSNIGKLFRIKDLYISLEDYNSNS